MLRSASLPLGHSPRFVNQTPCFIQSAPNPALSTRIARARMRTGFKCMPITHKAQSRDGAVPSVCCQGWLAATATHLTNPPGPHPPPTVHNPFTKGCDSWPQSHPPRPFLLKGFIFLAPSHPPGPLPQGRFLASSHPPAGATQLQRCLHCSFLSYFLCNPLLTALVQTQSDAGSQGGERHAHKGGQAARFSPQKSREAFVPPVSLGRRSEWAPAAASDRGTLPQQGVCRGGGSSTQRVRVG